MKKGMTTWLIVGGAVVLIGTLGFILLRKPKEEVKEDPKEPTKSDYELFGFVQKSNTPNVSILKGPMLFSGTLKEVENFTSIYARPSSTKGWWEVSDDGKTTIGYVPDGTLRKI